jgi:hypothetical protein
MGTSAFAGARPGIRFLEFFTANIRNPHTCQTFTGEDRDPRLKSTVKNKREKSKSIALKKRP